MVSLRSDIIFRGYGGYYKDVYLRSSLEYAYAYYLDTKNINWKYEVKIFDLNGVSYKPDFYIMKDDQLEYIVEIKSEENKQEGLVKVNKLKELYPEIDIRLISYKDLLEIYQNKMDISLNRARVIWKTEYDVSLNHDVRGENNPMYGKKHNKDTIKIIKTKSEIRFSDPEYRIKATRKMVEGNRRNGYKAQKLPRVKRETRTCEYTECKQEYVVTTSSKRKYCSQQCAQKIASALGRDAGRQKSREHLDKIKQYIDNWAINNRDIIKETPYNKITTNLSELFKSIEELYDIKDMRIISKAIFGIDKGRKELLRYLKQI